MADKTLLNTKENSYKSIDQQYIRNMGEGCENIQIVNKCMKDTQLH